MPETAFAGFVQSRRVRMPGVFASRNRRRFMRRMRMAMDRMDDRPFGMREKRMSASGGYVLGAIGERYSRHHIQDGRNLHMARRGGVRFDFPDEHQASLAFSLLQELGYEPKRRGREVEIRLDGNDLVSAIEIAAAHGGELAGAGTGAEDSLEAAYGLDEIPIPAHRVPHRVEPEQPEA